MSNLIIDWDNNSYSNQGSQIIDVYTTNLLEIPLDEFELADFAYYDALSNLVSETSSTSFSFKSR